MNLWKRNKRTYVPEKKNISLKNFDIELIQILEKAKRSFENKHLKSGIADYEIALQEYTAHDGYISYQLGAHYFFDIGNGIKARELFMNAINKFKSNFDFLDKQILGEIKAAAYENMMLLSLSHEEFTQYAKDLQELKPDHEILKSFSYDIQNAHNLGQPWAKVLEEMSWLYFDPRNQANNLGQYANAASVLELIVTHREQVEADRKTFSDAVWTFAALKHKIFYDCGLYMENHHYPIKVDEFRFLLDDTLPYLDSYIEQNPHYRNNEWYKNVYDGINHSLRII